ncbi:MAG: gfo/Idh/MocA family oxidoreductase [Chitinophagaceae bacterium]|jgi:predicted dehydrogenase|nr:MAG: gfo/Idh/MocA family oxidoreductase [Chitinophagaceae bacterium]
MIKLGIIGMSPGNAHPSSWSAIINGAFDGEEISRMGYPAVADYLEANKDTLGLPQAKVTNVWSQSMEISEQIARTAGIKNISDSLKDMMGKVDAVLLSRDDPENHVAMAKPIIDAGIPLFIDKPLCATKKDLDYFSNEIAKGRFVMSCSSMRYASECRSAKAGIKSLGNLKLITAVGKKDWIKYGVHMLEAIFSILDDPKPVKVINVGQAKQDIVRVEFENGLPVVLNLFMDISPTFQLSLFGQDNWQLIQIKNSYSSFRDTIIEFIRSVQEGKPRVAFSKTEQIIRTLIGAEESRVQGGKTINLLT